MDTTPQTGRAIALLNAVEPNSQFPDRELIPMHLIWRVAALMDDHSKPAYAAHSIVELPGGRRHGQVVLYAGGRVILAEIDDGDQVTVQTFRRSELQWVIIDKEDGRNADNVWAGDYKDWPPSRSVKAAYANGVTVTFPLGSDPTPRQAQEFGQFLPALLADLQSP